jgi:hypothetical protein
MAGRKKENFDRNRVEFMAEPAWVKRADDMAKRLGFGNLSVFIRFAVTEFMDRMETERGTQKKGKS